MKITLLFCAIICSVALHAQDYATLKGKILDHEMGDSPLAFAQITIGETGVTAESTLEGYFWIHDIVPGSYHISIAYPGYQTVRKPITITDQRLVDLSVSMHALVLNQKEVMQAHDQ